MSTLPNYGLQENSSADSGIYSTQAEAALAGAVLINPGVFASLDVKEDDFHIHRYRWIWSAVGRLTKKGMNVDLLTVSETLQRDGKLDEIGGLAALMMLINDTPSSMHAEDYAKIVKDYARRRRLMRLANNIATTARALDKPLETMIPSLMDELTSSSSGTGAASDIKPALASTLEEILDRSQDPKDVWGIRTGFVDFDDITGGLQPGEVLYLSGMPGVGKSIIAMQMGLQMARLNQPGAIYSLEMPASQVVRRWFSYLTSIPTRNLKSGRIKDADFSVLADAVGKLDSIPLYLSDFSEWTTLSLRADLARLKAMHDIQWFVLDYAYLLKDMPTMSENERSGYVSAQLKSICRSLEVAGIVVHSLRKSMGEPELMDLRGSGQQAYDSDLVIMVTRDDTQKEVLHCNFRKGRELENPATGFDLIKIPGAPAVGDAVKVSFNQMADRVPAKQRNMEWTNI